MRKITALVLATAMAASLTACGGGGKTSEPAAGTQSAGEAAKTEAPADTAAPAADAADAASYDDLDAVSLIAADNSSKGAAAQLFGELVAEKVDAITGGKLTIEYFPNSELGDDGDLLRQQQSNDIQIVVCQTAPVVSFVPGVAVFDLPMVFSKYDGDTIDKVLNGSDSAFRQELNSAYEAAGTHLLGVLQNATYRLTTANKELNTLADFKALQIRTMNNSNHMAFWTAIGAEPTPLAWSEVYFALQSGTIDAEENAADTVVGANLNEVQSVLACTNHILYANQMSINKEAYDALDPAFQAALNQAVSEAMAELRPQLADIDANNKKTLQDKGMKLIEYDNAFYDEILALDTVQKLYTDIDTQCGGLGTTLQESLESAAK
ncbi:TRAP transporter substrate-binding protein [[Clostridium] symbiosum]|uniref:TRAP transporter substrate-binding protein n=1 Tax=Clostridium symbiosum TaxID=1512 RepID=UPI001D0946C8|nr:TRAP transporter substrate-binding protein [[Clostridium] symbiosum]MCB6610303.1 TRAP transporter substrate-binding protein [[Clostridium] symbiosum]MCB6932404.1 TRAP transporter substrate-binding protein [[Clostridium] symbiosum]